MYVRKNRQIQTSKRTGVHHNLSKVIRSHRADRAVFLRRWVHRL